MRKDHPALKLRRSRGAAAPGADDSAWRASGRPRRKKEQTAKRRFMRAKGGVERGGRGIAGVAEPWTGEGPSKRKGGGPACLLIIQAVACGRRT